MIKNIIIISKLVFGYRNYIFMKALFIVEIVKIL